MLAPNMMERDFRSHSETMEERLILMLFLNHSHPNLVTADFKIVLKMVEKCKGEIERAIDPEHLKNLNKAEIEKELLEAYDLDNDNEVKWAEFNIFNQFLKKQPKNLRQIFRFFDKNHNWRIEHKELQKSKPKNIISFLGSGKRKWSHQHQNIKNNIINIIFMHFFSFLLDWCTEHNNQAWIVYNFISFFITSKWLTK